MEWVIDRWLKREFNFEGSDAEVVFKIKGEVLGKNKSLNEANITDDTIIFVTIPSLEQDVQSPVEKPSIAQTELNIDFSRVPEPFKKFNLAPKKPKDGYVCIPIFEELEKMTEFQLKKVENFCVKNEYGQV